MLVLQKQYFKKSFLQYVYLIEVASNELHQTCLKRNNPNFVYSHLTDEALRKILFFENFKYIIQSF